MASGTIRINTEEVTAIAGEIERINGQLKEQLENGRIQINSLGSTWTGEAATATKDAFNEFAGKYFQVYYDVIEQYVTFLRRNVSQGYFDVETTNRNLSDAFK